MVKTKDKTIDEIFAKLDSNKKDIAEKLRLLIKKTVPEATEMVRLGKITYIIQGKDFAWISFTKEHIDLDFVCGKRLASDQLKERGHGTELRHIEIKFADDVDEAELKRLIKKASDLSC